MNRLKTTIRYIPVLLVLLLSARLAHATTGTEAFEQGDFSAAETLLENEIAANDDPRKRLLLARIEMQRNEFESAYKLMDSVVDELPDDADAHYWLGASAGSLAGNVSLFRAARYARVVRKAFLRAIELDPQHVGAHQGLISYYMQAPGMLGGDKKEALALATRMTEFAPIEGKLRLAGLYEQMDKPEQARATLTGLTASSPDDPRAYLRLGFAYQADEDYANAIQTFRKATKAMAEFDQAEQVRMSALYQVGRTAVFSENYLEEGIDALTRYIEAAPGQNLPGPDWATYRRGQLHTMAGNAQLAQRDYTAAQAMTDDEDLLKAVKRVIE